MKKLLMLYALLTTQHLVAQSYDEQMTKAAEALQKKDYCSALTIFQTAFTDTAKIGLYDFYYAALAASRCHSEKDALIWLKKSQQKGLGLNAGDITFIENDSNFTNLHAYDEWNETMRAMKDAFAQKQEQEQKRVNNWLLRIEANRISTKETTRFNKPNTGFALYYITVDTLQVPYLVYVPKTYTITKPMQAIVYLHGGVVNTLKFAFDNPDIEQEPIFSAGETFNAIIVYPFGKKSFGWVKQQKAFENVLSIIKNVQQTYNIDSRRIFLGGMSNGGTGTFWFAMQKPNPFKGFFTFSAMPKLPVSNINFNNLNQGKPFYSLHAKDDAVFAYKEVFEIYSAHKAAAKDWHFETIENGNHGFIYDPEKGKEIMNGLLKKLLN
jgi:dienelactone hydrolase